MLSSKDSFSCSKAALAALSSPLPALTPGRPRSPPREAGPSRLAPGRVAEAGFAKEVLLVQLLGRRALEAAEVSLLLLRRFELPLRLCVGGVRLRVRVVVGCVGPAGAAVWPALLVEEELRDLRTTIAVPYFVFLGKRLPATRREIEEGFPAAVVEVSAPGRCPAVRPSLWGLRDVALVPD